MSRWFRIPALLCVGAMLCAGDGSAADGSIESVRLSKAVAESLAAWQNVQDYEAHFLKQEPTDKGEAPEEKIFFKFQKPFKLFMGWLNTSKRGLQVYYERGRHDGKLAIHKPGLLLGLAPVIFLDQNSPWVKEGSASFEIEDAGIGTFLDDFSKEVAEAERQERLRVKILDDKPEGLLAEVEFKDSKEADGFMARRVEVFFDGPTKLPTRMALFNENGALIGRYAYEELVLNAGVSGPVFKKQAVRPLFKMYTGTDDSARPSNSKKKFVR